MIYLVNKDVKMLKVNFLVVRTKYLVIFIT